MRHVRCKRCLGDKKPGTREIYPRSGIGEPAEFERVTRGIARTPQTSQRYVLVNGVREDLPLTHFNCDQCGAEIKPGEECGTWSVWTEDQRPVPAWEQEYLEVTNA